MYNVTRLLYYLNYNHGQFWWSLKCEINTICNKKKKKQDPSKILKTFELKACVKKYKYKYYIFK